MANLVGQVGCVTGFVALVIIGLAFGAGWLIDDWLGNERTFVTIIFMLGSFPITLYAMVRISLLMVERAQKQSARMMQQQETEDAADADATDETTA